MAGDLKFANNNKFKRILSALRGPLFFRVLDKVSQGIVITDEHQKIVLANEAFLKITGTAFPDIMNKRCSFMQGPGTDDGTIKQIGECLRHKREYNGEILNYRQDNGEAFWNELTIAPIIGDNGIHLGFMGITRDITPRKEDFAEITRRKRKYRVIFENVQAGLVLHDADGSIAEINPMARKLLMVDEGAIGIDHRNEEFWDFIRMDGSKMPISEYPLSLALENDGIVSDYIVGINNKSNEQITWVICNACPEIENGEIAHVLVSFTDITDLIVTEKQLKQSEERFRIVAKVASDAIWDADLVANTIWRSDGWTLITGRPSGLAEWSVNSLRSDSEDETRAQASFLHALESNLSSWEESYVLKDENGDEKFVRNRAVIMRNEAGQPVRAIGTISDLTTERSQSEALRRSERMSALGGFTGGVAHDFNNLLMIISGNSELLEDEILTDGAMEMVENIKQASRSGADLTGRLLSFARQQPLEADTVHLDQLFEDLFDMLRSMVPENIDLKFDYADGIWPILCDRSQIENALINLVLNSRDALVDGGTIEIFARNLKSEEVVQGQSDLQANDYVIVSVIDDGGGISPDILPSVLEPFFTTKASGSGSGLGLSMVYGFAKQSGGDLKIESSEGAGTKVNLFLPRSSFLDVKRVRKHCSELPRGTEAILVVEDNAQVLFYVEKLLLSLGYEVHTASDGVEAIKLLRDGLRTELLLTDVIMPNGIGGHQLAEMASKLLPDIKIIYMSGYLGTEALDSFQAQTTIPVLRKPYERLELANTIRNVLDE